MAKLLICGDKHLKITRFDLCRNFLRWLSKLIEDERPDMYIALGDDMDTHAVLRSEILSEFKEHINWVSGVWGVPMYYVLGNHDYFKPRDTTYHALETFIGQTDKFTVVEKRLDVGNITFVPYLNDLNDFPMDTKEICIAHQTFVGADYGYMRPEVGVDADLVDADIIISGHIHKRQEFGKVIYPGTPYAFNVNDVDQDKGIMIFDTETYEKKFIPAPFPRWRSLKFELGADCTIDNMHQNIKNSINKTDHWILQITGPKVEMAAYLDSKQYKSIIKGISMATKLTPTDNTKKKVVIKSITTKGIVTDYINKVYKGNIDKKILLNKTLDIVQKVDTFA